MSTPSNILFNPNKEALRRHLREEAQKQTEIFLQAAQAFYNVEHRTEDQCLALVDRMIEAINNVLQAGDWENSLFLKTTAKPLRELLHDAQEVRAELLRDKGLEKIEEYELKQGECKYYVSLYQSNGDDLARWALQLASIDRYMMGRPIYKNESDVICAIRRKLLQTSEAYAVIAVNQALVMNSEFAKEKIDRHGFELVVLEQGKVDASHVVEFVHNSVHYHYHNRRLIKKPEAGH